MAGINEVHEYILRLVDQAHGDVMVRHEDIDALFNAEQHVLFKELLGGKFVARAPLGSDDATAFQQRMLMPFQRTMQLNANTYDPATNPGGTAPGGYVQFDHATNHLDALIFVNVDGQQANAKLIGWHQYEAVASNMFSNPTNTALNYDLFILPVDDLAAKAGSPWLNQPGYELYPRTPISGFLVYYEPPTIVRYSYTVSGRTETFDPNASLSPLWPDEVVYGILIPRVLAKLGIQLDSAPLVQYGEQKGNEI